MHRVLVAHLTQEGSNKFVIVGDSRNPAISRANPVALDEAGGTKWAEFDDSTGFSSQYSLIPCVGTVSGLGYWQVQKTGNILRYDYAKAGVSERKVVTSGELHIEYDGRPYVALAGDSIMFLVDSQDREGDALRPFPVTFFGDHDCTVVFTSYAL